MNRLEAEVIRDAEPFKALAGEWDALAVAAAHPCCAPGWLLPWWRNAAPPGARLHTVAVREGSNLVGLAPFFVGESRAGPTLLALGAGSTTRVEPIAAAGRERDVAAAVAPALAQADASLLQLAGIPVTSPWPELLAQAWPGGEAWLYEDERMPAPVVNVDGIVFDEWFAAKSSNFRQQLRRFRRRLEERGAEVELAHGAKALSEAVAAFAELHRARWADRGGSGVLRDGIEQAVAEAARVLPPERFRLFVASADGQPVAASVFLAAGGEVTYWLGGFDNAWADTRPQMHVIMAAIEHAMSAGDRRVDLGAGGQEYKHRFAGGEEILRWVTLVAPGPGRLKTRLRLLPDHVRLALGQRLSPRQKAQIKRVLRRRS
jgi:CelD/BcsL family acetyltransferase involved in cellulose biosynthesis